MSSKRKAQKMPPVSENTLVNNLIASGVTANVDNFEDAFLNQLSDSEYREFR